MLKAIRWNVVGAVLLAASTAACAQTDRVEERGKKGPFGAGIVLSAEASSKSVGLPVMPGAVERQHSEGDGNGLTLALWGGEFGFKIAVLQLSTSRPIDEVTAYYQDEMRRYGAVMDCSPGQPRAKKPSGSGSDNVLTCDGKSRADGRHVFKVGTKNNHRLVNIQPSGKEIHVDIVRVLATSD